MRPISVVMPVRNGMPFLAEALESIRLQNYERLEVIVVDDGSSDGSREFVRGFQDGFRPRLIELEGDGQGPAAARNAGIRACTSERIAFLDADDLWPPGRLTALSDALDSHPAAGIARGRVRNFRMNPAGAREFFTTPFYCLVVGACLWRQPVFDTVGLLDEGLRIGEDYDFLLHCWEHDIRKVDADAVVLSYRRHPGSLTHDLKGPGFGALPVFQRRIQRTRAGLFDPSAPKHMGQERYLALGDAPPDPDQAFHG